MFALVFQKASGRVVGLYFSSAMAGCTGARPVQLERITGTAGLRNALTAATAETQRMNVERRMLVVGARIAARCGRQRAGGSRPKSAWNTRNGNTHTTRERGTR